MSFYHPKKYATGLGMIVVRVIEYPNKYMR